MTNSAKAHQRTLKALGKQEIHRLPINYKGEAMSLQWRDLVVTPLPRSPNLISPRVRQPDDTGL